MSHLNSEQLGRLRQLLEQERLRLREDIRNELRADGSALAGAVHDSGEEAVADMMGEINTAMLGHSIRELREVEAAQQRLHEGGYGYCEECGEAIPFARLEVYPAARLCVADQQHIEEHEPQG